MCDKTGRENKEMKYKQEIITIMTIKENEEAIQLIYQNGYANSIQEAREIVDRMNGNSPSLQKSKKGSKIEI